MVASPLPPLAKGASRHRRPGVEQKVAASSVGSSERVLVDFEAAESFGRRILGEFGESTWATKAFQEADLSESGYLCPPEFAAVIENLKRHIGLDASAKFRQHGGKFDFTTADTSLEGRICNEEWVAYVDKMEEAFGFQRCVRATARYLGTRQAEARRRIRGVELFEGYSIDASLNLLTACNHQGSPALYETVRSALEGKADPNASLLCPLHSGYSSLIFLAKTAPTQHGGQVAKAMRALLAARADPHRESGRMPFGRWTPLRFAAFMQNIEGLNVLLEHIDAEGVLGDRFQWAANENVEHVMLEELSREFGADLVDQVASRSRFSMLATVLLQQYASPIAGGSLTPAGATQLIEGKFQSGKLPMGDKANPNGAGLEGRTALMDMVEAGDVKTVRALIRGRADPNQKDSSGATALHIAASNLQVEVVRNLLDAKAEPHEVDHGGFSPWMVVGEQLSHSRGEDGRWHVRTDGRLGNPEARRDLLELLKPTYTPEEILSKLQEDWRLVVDPGFAGEDISLDGLAKRFRLSESLFFSSKLADGHGAHEGRRERPELLKPFAAHICEFLRTEHLKGNQKVLTRYLLSATMGPSFKTACAHVHTPWPTEDNRALYRDKLFTVSKDMLGQYAEECGRMRRVIETKAELEPHGPCAALRKLPKDVVTVPDTWRESDQPDYLFWKQVQRRQLLRFDPPWALEVGGSPARCCLALLRLGAVEDLEECAELNQVYHASLSEFFARGYVQYSELCNKAFQEKMRGIAQRVAEREGLNVSPPAHLVGAKKLKRIMEKIQEAREEHGRDMEWPGRPPEYVYYSHAFHILDTVRLSFTCNGKTTEEQVEGCMKLFEEFRNCTVANDGLCVLRQKNGFAAGVNGSGGYADVKLLVYADLGYHRAFDGTMMPLRIVGEIQLILEGYMKVKSKMHLVYEVDRGSFERDKSAKSAS